MPRRSGRLAVLAQGGGRGRQGPSFPLGPRAGAAAAAPVRPALVHTVHSGRLVRQTPRQRWEPVHRRHPDPQRQQGLSSKLTILLLELPLLSTHGTLVIYLLRMKPLHYTMNMETV